MPTPSVLIVPNRLKAGILYSQLPANGDVDFSVTRATTAFRTNASGILESVASGVPRLDYPIGGGCPSLLVEPAATNLFLRSEEFDNASWLKTGLSVSGNALTAPNGTLTADLITTSSTSNNIRQAPSVVSGTTYTFSCYVKNGDANTVSMVMTATAFPASAVDFNLVLGTATVNLGTPSFTIINIGDGWYRCTMSVAATSSAGGTCRIQSASANAISTFYTWGAQIETGSVATSYIPTVAATATRNADVISKTGVSGFIGQTQGTLYAEVDLRNFLTTNVRIFGVSDGTSSNRIILLTNSANRITLIISNGGAESAQISTPTLTAGVYKIAVGYAVNDFVLYVNGAQIGTDTSGAIPPCSAVFLGKIETSSSSGFLNDRIRAAAIYPTRLTNSQLSSLTTL
jgi:hypothetical protein